MHVRDLYGVLSGRKVYTSSDRMSLLPIFGGSHYRHLVAHTRCYKLARERKTPKSLGIVLLRILCIECWLLGFLLRVPLFIGSTLLHLYAKERTSYR
jgi:hypothetical protein